MTDVTKTVSFRSPYIGRTFQRLTQLIQGRDGYLSGGQVTEAGGIITVAPFSFVQRGVVVEEADPTTGIAVPTLPEPWFVLAATPDDEPESGVVVVATEDIAQVLGGDVLIAYKTNGSWKNPRSIAVDALRRETATESGAELGFTPFPVTTGADPATITDVKLSRGLVVDPSGSRRELADPVNDPVAAFGASGLGLVRDGVGIGYFRNDYAVLRQNEDGTGSIVHVYGNAQGQGGAVGDNALDEYEQVSAATLSATGTLPSSFGRRGDRSYWHCWGDGAELKINGFHQTAGAIASTVVLTGSGSAIHSVAVAGQNAADSVVVVYSDTSGTQDVLQVVGINPQTGAVVSGPSGVATSEDPGGFLNTRAVMGPGEVVHIVTQEDLSRAAPDQVVRYFKVSAAAATFGTTAGTTPDFDLGTNDTFPSIGLDRQGHAHIAYTKGTGSLTSGELRYVEVDELGVQVQAIAATSFAGNDDPFDPAGLSTMAFEFITKPVLVVTPHDEVYVFAIGSPLGTGNPSEVVVFSPDFSDRFAGHHCLQLALLFGAEMYDSDKSALAVVVDDHGSFIVGASDDNFGLVFARLDTKIAPDGIVGRGYLEAYMGPGGSIVDSSLTGLTGLNLAVSGIGGLLWGYTQGSTPKGRLTGQMSAGRMPTPHPHDVYLGVFEAGATPFVDPTSSTPDERWFRSATLRPKRGGHTIVVGDGGDYAGSLGLVHAIGEASVTGAEIYVKGGEYYSGRPLAIPGGVKIKAERTAKLHFYGRTSNPWMNIGQLTAGAIPCASVAADNYIVTLGLSQEQPTRHIRPGDTVVTNTNPLEHKTVVQILDSRRVVLSSPVTVAGLTNCTVYSSNVEIGGVSCTFAYQVSPNLQAGNLKNSRLDGLIRDDAVELLQEGLVAYYCVGTVFERLQFWNTSSAVGLRLEAGLQNQVRHCQFSDQGGTLEIAGTESHPRISDCIALPTANDPVYLIESRAADDLVLMVNCTGEIADTDGARVATGVADNLIDQTYMTAPVQLADANNIAIPPGVDSAMQSIRANCGKPGFTVSDGTSNYAWFGTIQDALAWLAAAGTGDGIAPEIVVTEQIDLGVSVPISIDLADFGSLVIRGEGEKAGFTTNQDSSIFQVTNTGGDATQNRKVRFEGLSFQNTLATTPTITNAAIEIVSGDIQEVVVRDCRVNDDSGSPVYGIASFLLVGFDCNFEQLVVENNRAIIAGHGVRVDGTLTTYPARRAHIRGNYFETAEAVAATGISVTGGRCWIVDNEVVGELANGILVGHPPGTDSDECVIRGNRVSLSTTASQIGIRVSGRACHVTDNTVECTGTDSEALHISYGGGDPCDRQTVTGNILRAERFGINLFQIKDSTISGNIIEVVQDDAGDYGVACIYANNSDRLTIHGNELTWNGQGGIGLSWGHALIYLDATSTHSVVSGNTFIGSTSAPAAFNIRPGGVHMMGDAIVVCGNMFRLYGSAGTYAAFVRSGSASNSCVVLGNTFVSYSGSPAYIVDESGSPTLEKGVGTFAQASGANVEA